MVEEFIATDIWTIARTNHGSVVFLRPRKSNVAIPVIIGEFELQAILLGKKGIKMPRPMTHDLILNLIRQFQYRFKRAEIHSLQNDTFHARLILENRRNPSEKAMEIDCRPSDAIALAIRKKCDIYISTELIIKTGIPLDFFMEEIENTAESMRKESQKQPGNQYKELIKQLNKAIEAEEYEKAAKIRDMLIQLETS